MMGKTWDMHKRAFQALKRMFMHFSGLPLPYFNKKQIILLLFFILIKILWGKTWDLHKRAFQDLKRTFMQASGLPPPDFDLKNQLLNKMIFF